MVLPTVTRENWWLILLCGIGLLLAGYVAVALLLAFGVLWYFVPWAVLLYWASGDGEATFVGAVVLGLLTRELVAF